MLRLAHSVLFISCIIRERVDIDHYCKIGVESRIGKNTRILYGKHVYDQAVIGENCIIGGHVADRTIIEDNVTFFGEIAHSHRNASLNWDETVASPTIQQRKCCRSKRLDNWRQKKLDPVRMWVQVKL